MDRGFGDLRFVIDDAWRFYVGQSDR